ncbi:lysocardiolipin acyltransferase 1-like [Paramacrobiotus metropolitanus]|uniref:lysocardiolipin acyltransferase 1-like n=1 Tax=Paramacrobiotus metropolitanus TaxID=2943436 RepID=UPI002445A945|nr:lysocardiolipin acyltransferase 1-like [Paramacrobiotus metropolitanus]XP_055357617.1 lysocardiolipin acyltransferase 1-like [Paramacrobiotus metropolitanus]
MSRLISVLRGIRGVLFCLLMFLSSALGSVFVLFPTLPLLYVNRRLFRWLGDHIIALWESYPVALLHILCRVDIRIFGDEIDPEKNSLIIMNHRTRLDWLFLWTALYPDALPRHKIILKRDLKRAPGTGWSMQCAGFLFIDRKWESDQELFHKAIEYVSHDNRKVNMLLFPEGTDFNPRSQTRSDAFALTNARPKLLHCIYPRVRGFTFLAELMRKYNVLDEIYDITIVYPKEIIQSEPQMLLRGPPSAIYFLIKRHGAEELPASTTDLESWLSDCWTNKEQELAEFYKSRQFPPKFLGRQLFAIPLLWVSLIVWTALIVFWLWLLSTSLYADIFFVIGSGVYCFFTYILGGVDRFELRRFLAEKH